MYSGRVTVNTGAESQQERLDADWVVGFVDGEGCFFVGISRQPSMKIGWQVLPEIPLMEQNVGVAILEQAARVFRKWSGHCESW